MKFRVKGPGSRVTTGLSVSLLAIAPRNLIFGFAWFLLDPCPMTLDPPYYLLTSVL